jgi:hypothetical protein
MAIANYFYNETTRRYVALFGTMFNQLKIQRKSNDGTVVQDMIVPLSYAPFQKVLSRVQQDPDLLNSRATAIRLPRMSFEITSLAYDPARKLGSTHKMVKKAKAETESSRNFVHSSVPYNIEFSLYIMTKYSEDATKVMEQIIPFFTPDWTVTAKMVDDLDPIDIPIILNSVTTEDLYEGDYESRQTILYTLTFTMKGWYFGPEKKAKVIKFIDVDLATDTAGNATAEDRITIKPGLDSNGNPLSEPGVGVTAAASLLNGSVNSITITDDGENYNPNNAISVTVGAPDTLDAAISPVITDTSIGSYTINEGGGFYSAAPSLTITPPNMAVTNAEASQNLTGGSITSIDITNQGTYYSSAGITIAEPPTQSPYVKFGDDALYHNDYTDTTTLHTTGMNFITAGSGYAIEFWIYPTEFHASDNVILHIQGSQMRVEIEDGTLALHYAPGGAPCRSTPEEIVLNQWNHCRVEHFGANARWLINGTADAGTSGPQGFLLGGGQTVVAGQRSTNERSFIGALDNVTISTISGLTPAGSYVIPTAPTTGTDYTGNYDKDIATADLVVTNGKVMSVTMTNSGANYDANTVITISAPNSTPAAFQAVATPVLIDGAVSSITINNAGRFYTSANVAISSVTANTATAEIIIGTSGQATSINVTNTGSGYRTPPVITIAGPAATSVPYQQIEFDDDWGIITIFEDA